TRDEAGVLAVRCHVPVLGIDPGHHAGPERARRARAPRAPRAWPRCGAADMRSSMRTIIAFVVLGLVVPTAVVLAQPDKAPPPGGGSARGSGSGSGSAAAEPPAPPP